MSKYSDLILADAPNAYFPMGEASGRIRCVITGAEGVEGETTSSLPTTLGSRPGPLHGTLSRDFSGNSQHFRVPSSQVEPFFWNGGDYTAEWWSLADSTGSDSLISFRTVSGATDEGLSIFGGIPTSGAINIDMGSSGVRSVTENAYSLNEWTHFAFTYTAANTARRIYRNGTLYWTEWTKGHVSGRPASPLYIGMLGGNASYSWDGCIAHIALWKKALTAEQIAAHYAARFDGTPKIWNGTAWVEKPVKVWNGTEWAYAPIKRHNGSEWVYIDGSTQ